MIRQTENITFQHTTYSDGQIQVSVFAKIKLLFLFAAQDFN